MFDFSSWSTAQANQLGLRRRKLEGLWIGSICWGVSSPFAIARLKKVIGPMYVLLYVIARQQWFIKEQSATHANFVLAIYYRFGSLWIVISISDGL